MANQLFRGYVYDDAGAAIVGAAVNLYDRNTTTPSLADTTTDATGLWTISHATEGRYDVEIVSGSSKRRRKYDDQIQIDTIEVANLRVRNPTDTFDYDVVPAAITADRQLNLPLITATQTLLDTTRGLTLAGENNTEGTSNSTSAGDRVTVSSLSIPVTSIVIIMANVRKSAGAADRAAWGLKVNTTVVHEALSDGTRPPHTSATNQAENGMVIWILGPQVTNYLRAGMVLYAISAFTGQTLNPLITADMPNATITSIAIRGISQDAGITHGVDEVRVFVLPTVAP